MNVEQHAAKAKRVLNSLRKLHFPEDYLAIVDGAVIAGYHLGNALMHKHGVSSPTQHSNSPSKLEAGVPSLPIAIQPAFEAFSELERLRFEFVRSPSTWDATLAQAVQRNLEIMRRAVEQ
jgi:hypothetical protein